MTSARETPERYGERLLSKLWALDALLVQHGFPAMSPWWRATIERFYRSGKRQLTVRAGRRAGKSSTFCRVAVVEALYGEHDVPPGDEGVFAIISTKLGEAGKRLITIQKILETLGVAYEPLGKHRNGIRLSSKKGKPIAFELFAATVAGVSGFTSIGALCDEVAKWRDEDTGSNPATEVLRSLRPTMATMPRARLFMVSSPFSTLDAHFEAMKEGETSRQCVAEAATWIANPTITEADTHELEPDEATRMREYGAVPMSGGESFFFDHATIDAALGRAFDPRGAKHACGVDPAFRSDSAAAAVTARIIQKAQEEGAPPVHFVGTRDLLELTPRPGAPLVPGPTVRAFCDLARPYGVRQLATDFHCVESVREHASKEGFSTVIGFDDKVKLYLPIRVAFAREGVSLGEHSLSPKLARQLKETMCKPTASGTLSIWSPRRQGSHGDIASAWILGASRVGAGREERAEGAGRGIACGSTRMGAVAARRGRSGGRRSDVAGAGGG